MIHMALRSSRLSPACFFESDNVSLGSSVQECVNFMGKVPRPPKGLSTKFCAVLQKDRYDVDGTVLICKAMGDGKEPQTIPCRADKMALFYVGFERGEWRENYRMQVLH